MSKSSKSRDRCKKLIRANISMDRDDKDRLVDLYGFNMNQLIENELNSFKEENFSYKEIKEYYKIQNAQLKEKNMNIKGLVFFNDIFNSCMGGECYD